MIENRTSFLEILEARIAPAGLINAVYDAATGELTLTGDGADNSVQLFQTGPNTYRLESETTDINALGTGILDIGKLTRVTIDGGGGSDSFGLTSVRTLKSLSFSGGDGDDSFFANDVTVKGPVEIHGNAGDDTMRFSGLSTTISGNVTIDSAQAGADSIDVQFNAQKTIIGGRVLFTGGGGLDIFQTDGTGVATIAKGIDFNAGAGGAQLALLNDTSLSIGKLPTGEAILFTGGDGNDALAIATSKTTLASGIRMTGADSSNVLSLGHAQGSMKIGKLSTGQSIHFTGGADGDLLFTESASLTLTGGIDFSAGDGSNSIDLANPSGTAKIGKFTGGQSIRFTGGSGIDTIASNLTQTVLIGGIEFDGADGGNQIDFDDAGLVKVGKFGTGQSIAFTGTSNGFSNLELGGFVSLAGSVELAGADGSDLDFDGSVIVGKSAAGVSVLVSGGDGEDVIDFQGNINLAGSLRLDGGDSDDEMDLTGIDTLIVKGAVEMIGGAGDDSFNLQARFATLGSTLTFTGGDGADTVTVGASGSIAGDFDVDLGPAAAGAQALLVIGDLFSTSLVLKRSLILEAAGATTADTLTLKNVSVSGLIDLGMGDGVSTVNLDNLIAGDELRLDTRGGADVVNIERNDLFGGSVIKKLATIQLGLGDDELAIGNPLPALIPPFPDHTRVHFLGGLTADGGGGPGDNRNDFGAENTFGVPLTAPVGFELLTLV